MIRNDRRREDLLINVTPMIDVMIFLIIFFLAATSFTQLEREHEVLLPETRATGSLSKILDASLIINVKKGGELVVEGRQYGRDELQALVARRNAMVKNGLKVQVRADKRTLHGNVALVLDAVEKAGVARSFIDTKQTLLEP